MNKTLIKQAQIGLRLVDIALRDIRGGVKDGFDPKYAHGSMGVQLMQRTLRSEVLEVVDKANGKRRLFHVYVKVGARWVEGPAMRRKRKGSTAADTSANVTKEPDVLADIEATWLAEYLMLEAVEKAALDEFAQFNAPFNIWPFWREYVVGHAARMNLPKVVLPLQPLGVRRRSDESDAGQDPPPSPADPDSVP